MPPIITVQQQAWSEKDNSFSPINIGKLAEMCSIYPYFAKTVAGMGVTENDIVFEGVEVQTAGMDIPVRSKVWAIKPTKEGDIEFTPVMLNRSLWQREYTNSKAKVAVIGDRVDTYSLLRYAEPEKHGGMRYKFPAKEKFDGFLPFLPRRLLQAYEAQTEIHTLYITEGYKKAIVASLHGIMCVGLPSITLVKELHGDMYQLPKDILRIIAKCKVQNVCILWDADCLNISKTALEKCEELTKRPTIFANMARQIQGLLPNAVKCYFMYPKSFMFRTLPKGLDDVIAAAIKEYVLEDVLTELADISASKMYFHTYLLKDKKDQMNEILHINTVQKFYDIRKSIIKDTDFMYHGNIYEMDGNGDIKLKTPKEALEYVCIKGDYFHKVKRLDNKKTPYISLEPIKEKGIRTKYKTKLWIMDFIPYYDGIENAPDNIQYERAIVVEDCSLLNFYEPVKLKFERHDDIMKGWDTIGIYMMHIFGKDAMTYKGKKMMQTELGFDYLKSLLFNPRQNLPILCLVSEENATGKSTFVDFFMKTILQKNVVVVESDDITGDFNAHFAGKFLIGIEEGRLDATGVNKMKALSTRPEVFINDKGVSRLSMKNFSKYILMSNKVKNFAALSAEDERFWVRKIPTLLKYDSEFKEKVLQEMPYFLNFLQEREYATENEGRMFFAAQTIETDALREVKAYSVPPPIAKLREFVVDYFVKNQDETKCCMTEKMINEMVFNKQAPQNLSALIEIYLKLKKKNDTTIKFNIQQVSQDEEARISTLIHRDNGRYYQFDRYAAEFKDYLAPMPEIIQTIE